MESFIFYSWQSDLPKQTTRYFILDALKKVAMRIKKDDTIEIHPRIDHDTLGVAGSPDIVDTIFEKINRADIFVCDVTIINKGSRSRKTPNPNVLIELGYAMKAMSPERIILIYNTAYGKPEQLPFDLQRMRLLTYTLTENETDKSVARKVLETKLEEAVRLIAGTIDLSTRTQPSGPDLAFRASFLRQDFSPLGVSWERYRMLVEVTSLNNIASENGAVRLIFAYPMQLSETVREVFGIKLERCGYYSDGREEDPHAQSARLTWNASNGLTIFPNDWYNFHDKPLIVDIPSRSVIENPVFLLKVGLFSSDSTTRQWEFYIQRQPYSDNLVVDMLPPDNQTAIIDGFWHTYHHVLEAQKRELESTRETKHRIFGKSILDRE